MGIFSSIKSSVSKTFEISNLSRILGDVKLPKTVDELLDDKKNKERENAKVRLFNLCQENKELKVIMVKHNASIEDLEVIFNFISVCGAGQWIKGHYVAVEALAFQTTLDYLLCNLDKIKESYNDRLRVCYRLIEYFNKGEVGIIHPDE